MKDILLTKITDEYIEFSDGKKITYFHDQECCECNFADFKALENIVQEMEGFDLPLTFERIDGLGFRFGNKYEMYFVPCYSFQNGYYTDEITIKFDGEDVFVVKCNEII